MSQFPQHNLQFSSRITILHLLGLTCFHSTTLDVELFPHLTHEAPTLPAPQEKRPHPSYLGQTGTQDEPALPVYLRAGPLSAPKPSALKIPVFPPCGSEAGEGGGASITVVGLSCRRWGFTLTDWQLRSGAALPVRSVLATSAKPNNHYPSSIWVLLRGSTALSIITEVSAPLPAEGKAICPPPPDF